VHRLVARSVLAEPEERRLQALAAAVLDQPADVEAGVLALARMLKAADDLLREGDQPLTRIAAGISTATAASIPPPSER
jgi:2-keto-4-pentenoate hydratase